ncbi:membrane metallo-endopeptidase-like 1 isoform X2 [Dermacentor variabilis]
MSVHGVDGLVRAVAITGNTSGNQEVKTMLELSAPIEELFAYEILSMGGKTLKEAAFQLVPDEDHKMNNFEKFVQNYSLYTISNTMTATQNMPTLVTLYDLKNTLGTQTWNWKQYFHPFEALNLDYLQDDSTVKLAHPKYLLGLDEYLETWVRADQNFYVILDVYLQVMANINLKGHLALKDYAESGKPAACVMLGARLFPAAMDHLIYYQRLKQFGAPNGINPGGANDIATMKFLRSQVQGMLDSFTFSYSLSQSVTEENRVRVYRRVSRLMVSPGFLNETDGKLTDTAIKELALNVPAGDDFTMVDALDMSRQTFPALYWKTNSSYHMFRNQYSPLYATYTPSLNHLYVPMGVFTKPVFRNSQKNRIFTAAAGYLVMSGFMKALTMSGAMVSDGILMPENWVGYSWSRKMERYATCMMADRKKNATMESLMDIHLLASVVPAYRYYKRMVLEKAFPRPEFRIDWVSDLSSTQLFFYNWALLHCGSDMGKELIDLAAKNNPYFHQSFKCEKGAPMYKAKPCMLWNTTRINY